MSAHSSKALVALTLISIPLGIAIVEVTLLGLRVYSPERELDGSLPVPPPVPAVNIDVEPRNISIRQGESGNLTVTVIALPYQTERAITSETAVFLQVHLNPYPSFAVGFLPEDVTAAFNPPSVTLQPRGEANSTLTLKVDSVALLETYSLSVYGAWRWGDNQTTSTGTSFYLTVYGDNPPPQRPFHELKLKIFLTPGVLLGMPNTVDAYSENYIRVLVWNLGSSREEDVTVQIFVDGVKVQDKALSLAGYPETYDAHGLIDTHNVVSKRWVPTAAKTCKITAVAFNPYTYAQNSLEVNDIGAPSSPPLTTLPLIMLTLLLGSGALAIVWLTLLRRRTSARAKSVIFLVVLGSLLVYFTLYTAAAHEVARRVYEEDGEFFWRGGPNGSFFPWPREPGMYLVLGSMNGIDLFIYVYLIKSGVLVLVTILLWISLSLYILKLTRVFDTFRFS